MSPRCGTGRDARESKEGPGAALSLSPRPEPGAPAAHQHHGQQLPVPGCVPWPRLETTHTTCPEPALLSLRAPQPQERPAPCRVRVNTSQEARELGIPALLYTESLLPCPDSIQDGMIEHRGTPVTLSASTISSPRFPGCTVRISVQRTSSCTPTFILYCHLCPKNSPDKSVMAPHRIFVTVLEDPL